MQAISSALFFIVPVFSVFLLFVKLSVHHASQPECRDRSSRLAFPSYLAFSFFGILSIISGSLGLVAYTLERRGIRHVNLDAGEHVVVALIKFGLGLSVMYVFATTVPSSIVPSFRVLWFNIVLNLLLACATILNVLLPFLKPQTMSPIICPIFSLLTAIFPFPLLVILLHSQATRLNSKATSLWLTLAFSQIAATVSSAFGLSVAQDHTFVEDFRIVQSIFLVLWITGIMIAFHLLPSRHPESNRVSLRPRPSKSPSPSSSSTQTSPSDFLNLRDPFASPPPRSPIAEKTSFSYFGGPRTSIFKPKKVKGNITSRVFMNAPPLPPSTFPGNDIGPREIMEFDRDEALLSQLLLRNLDSDLDLTLQQRESDAVGLGLGHGISFADIAMDSAKRERIIVNCERRGSESTVTSSHDYSPSSSSFPLPFHQQQHRLTHGSTGSAATLYEPSSPVSPSWKEMALDMPVSQISPPGIVQGHEQHNFPVSSGHEESVYNPPVELELLAELEIINPVPGSQELEDPCSDDDATPRALSPS